MVAAVVEANAAIFQGAHTNPDQRGMGTTVTAMAAMPPGGDGKGRFVVANVGDSRTYVQRSGRLRRVSVDHSYVQELVSTGHITELEARSHPRRNIVTRALGIEPTVRVDTWVQPLIRGDRYVLCSDGLVDEVDDDEIAAILAANPQPQAAADALVLAACTNGGRDNVTVVVVDVLEGDSDPADDTSELLLAVDLDDQWDDDADHLIDAEAGAPTGGPGLAGDDAADAPVTRTMEMPVMAGGAVGGAPGAAPGAWRARRRSPLGWFLFALGLGVIVTLTVVFVLVVQHNEPDPAPTTTSSTTTSSTSTTTTTTTPSTTSAPSSTTGASSTSGP